VIYQTIESMRRAWSSIPSPSELLDRFLDQLEEFSIIIVEPQDEPSCNEVPVEARLRLYLDERWFGRH
jgi:hypothetical protein